MAKITQIVGTGNIGDDFPKINQAIQTVETDWTITWDGNSWTELSVSKSWLSLDNVDNTSDANKPVSTAGQTALDLKADDSAVVKLTGNQTVAGVKTFSSSPVVPAPTTDLQAATKKYVDDNWGWATAFTWLTDTPADYSWAANKVVQVNAGADWLEFVTLAWWWDMLASTYDPTTVAWDAFDMDNMAEWTTNKILTGAERTILGNTSNTNSWDQTSIAWITGTTAQFNTALSDWSFSTWWGTATWTNTWDQTTIAWITWTTAEFNTALSDWSFATWWWTASGTNTGDMSDANVKTAYENNADTNAYVDADETKVWHITVTQAVDLDQMETDIAALANWMVYKWDWDASVWTFPWAGSAQTGWFYYVSVAWTVDSVSFNVWDNIVATTDDASTSTYAANWSKHDQTAAVQTVFSRIWAVVATDWDYSQSLITGLKTTDSPQFTWVNVWHATDTTLTRVSAGKIAVEWVNVSTISSTDTLTNKSIDLTDNTVTGTKAEFDTAVTDGNITYDGDNVSVLTNDSNYTPSDPSGVTGADQVTNLMSLTQSEYDAITPNSSTFYIITT